VVGLIVLSVASLAGAPAASAHGIPASFTTVRTAAGAGYLSTVAAGLVSASATFVVPAVSCASDTDYESVELGVFGIDGDGNHTSYAAVAIRCDFATVPSYTGYTSTEFGTGGSPIAPGDKIVVSLTETPTETRATLRNITQGDVQYTYAGPSSDASMLVGDLGSPVVPTFTQVTLTKVQVNGVYIADAKPLTRWMLQSSSALQVAASVLHWDSDTFRLVWRSSA
jgi:hypothetical protein